MDYKLPTNIDTLTDMSKAMRRFALRFDDYEIWNHYNELADKCLELAWEFDDEFDGFSLID